MRSIGPDYCSARGLRLSEPTIPAPSRVQFGPFHADLQTGELWANGKKIKLEGQPFQILALLLERAGQLVTREEFQQKLWPGDTFVDFEHSINTAVKRLREVLGDSADAPRFIETLPRHGYRFIYPVERAAANGRPPLAWWQRRWIALALGVIAVATGLLASNVGGLRDRMSRSFGSQPAPGEITGIAVLPLRNISGDAGQNFFAEGITEMLITELGRVGAVRVPSHQTVLQYYDTRKPMPEIARELKVDALIEGTVLRAGNRVRITINLVQVQPERHLLSEKYDRDLRDILLVQDDVTRAVASKIRASLTPDQQRHFAKPRSVDPEVNEAFLKGRFHFSRGTDRDRAKAYEYFQKAVQKDPGFAPGYAAMALLDAHGGAYRAAEGGPQFRAQTRQLALKALELDDTLAEAHVALGWMELTDWDFAGADREFKRAIELNPNLATARIWYISYLTLMLRIEEADAQGEVALQLNPASVDVVSHVANHYLFVANHYLFSARVDKAIELYRKALDLEPNYHFAHWALGKAYYLKGMYQESVAELEKAIALSGRNIPNLCLIAPAYIKAGKRKEGLEVLRELDGRWKQPTRKSGQVAFAYIGLGDKDKAFDRLEKAYEHRGLFLTMLVSEPLYEPLRSDPRFHDLVRRIGFPQDTLRRAGIPTENLPPPAANTSGKSARTHTKTETKNQ